MLFINLETELFLRNQETELFLRNPETNLEELFF